MKKIILCVLVLLLSLNCFSVIDENVIVETKQGYVEGLDEGNYLVFKGIPYAKPPVGNLRWKAPQPPQKFSFLFRAHKYGSPSLQIAPSLKGISGGTKVIGSEDCLYLNIWVPKYARSEKLPVMFWIHGGAYILGAGAQEIGPINIYDGARMAKEGKVIVVSHNYRLGAMGFFAHEDLRAETKTRTTGNYGLLDHIAALKWVKNNIANFGGDPKSVTIFGESAGGASVLALLASKLAKGLFSKAIVQSGPFLHNELSEHLEMGNHFVKELGLEDSTNKMRDMRKIPAEDIVRQFQISEMPRAHDDPMIRYGYTVDGHVLDHTVLETIERGEHNKVPVMIGTNKDEMKVLAPAFLKKLDKNSSDEEIKKMIEDFFDTDTAKKIIRRYNTRKHGSAKEALSEFMSDALFHAPAKQVADALERYNPGSVYKYLYSKEIPGVKAGHATELPYLFGTEKIYRVFTFPYKDMLIPILGIAKARGKFYLEKMFSKMLMRYWTRFAWSGTPNDIINTNGDKFWPGYKTGQTLELNDDPQVIQSFRKKQVEFVDEVTRPTYIKSNLCMIFFK